MSCYIGPMGVSDVGSLPADLAAELESRFFWWEPVGLQPRSHARILAQAMNLASFDDVRRLEKTLGPDRLAEAMLEAEPGWINERSWEFWRGRLALATGRTRCASSEIVQCRTVLNPGRKSCPRLSKKSGRFLLPLQDCHS